MRYDENKTLFDFEKLQVYQLALEFLDHLCNLSSQLSHEVRYPVGDQLVRAALSISNNLAEGTGKRSKKEKARYYATAIDSARECISMVNVLIRQNQISQTQYDELRAMGRKITGMLYGLIQSLNRTP